MEEIQQRFVDNLVFDLLLSIVLLAGTLWGLYYLAKLWKVSTLPLLVLLPSFLTAGLTLYVPLSPFYLRSDGEYYQDWGFSLASAWLSGEAPDPSKVLWPGKGVWPLIIGGLSAVSGPVTITLIVFNSLILVLTAVLLQKATYMLGGKSPRWSMVILFLTSSPILLWGPSLLREALFWLGVTLGVLALSYASVRLYRFAVLAVGLSVLLLVGIRPDAGIVLVYGFVAMLFFLLGTQLRRWSLLQAATWLLPSIFLAISFTPTFEFLRGGQLTVEEIVTVRNELAEANTSFVPPSDTSEPSSCESLFSIENLLTTAICKALWNLPSALFGPFYWEYEPSAIWFAAAASTLHFLVLVGFSTYSLLVSKGSRWPHLALLAVATASVVMFSSILTNYGILIRFRAATEIMLTPLALVGLLEFLAKRKCSSGKVQIPQ